MTVTTMSVLGRRPASTLATVASVVVGVPLGAWTLKTALLVLFQNKVIYLPSLPIGSISEWALGQRRYADRWPGACETITCSVQQSRGRLLPLEGWFLPLCHAEGAGLLLPQQQQSQGTIITFHGNGGNISHRMEFYRMLQGALRMDIVAPEYRGYGVNRGRPSEAGLQQDAHAWADDLVKRAEKWRRPIFMHGHSLGASVLSYLLATRQDFCRLLWPSRTSPATATADGDKEYGAVILENAFSSIEDVVKDLYPRWTPYWHATRLLWNRWPTADYVASANFRDLVPRMFVVSGSLDEVVSTAVARRVFDRCACLCKEWTAVPRGLHNDTWTKPEFAALLRHAVGRSSSKV